MRVVEVNDAMFGGSIDLESIRIWEEERRFVGRR
jgi:hypothetical protein